MPKVYHWQIAFEGQIVPELDEETGRKETKKDLRKLLEVAIEDFVKALPPGVPITDQYLSLVARETGDSDA